MRLLSLPLAPGVTLYRFVSRESGGAITPLHHFFTSREKAKEWQRLTAVARKP